MSITIYQGSILDVEADCIVNPANSFLRHGGGLAAIIAKAARGPQMPNPGEDERVWWSKDRTDPVGAAWDREQAAHPLIPTGGAGWTSAGHLSYRGIVHAVGPIWGGGEYLEKQLLAMAYANACSVAHEHGCRSIALPAISCGIFGFPVHLAAKQALKGVEFWADPQPHGVDMKVTFALFEDEHVDAFTAVMG